MKTIIFIKPANSSFIQTDQRILEKHYNVLSFQITSSSRKLKYLLSLVSLTGFLLRNFLRSDAYACWFANYHAVLMIFFAKIARKPSLIFVGGQEAICYPELGKGVYVNKLRGMIVKYALRNCTLILPNHKSLIYHENHFYNPESPHIDGIKYYVKKIKGEFVVIPNGIDSSRIDRDPQIVKESDLILTVGTMNKIGDFYNKGFDIFIQVAKRNPDLRFVLIGLKEKYLSWVEENYQISGIRNLKVILSYCPDEILNEYYNKALVYVQVSITEGMPVSLGEAMICECVPVGSNVNGIPDAIGEYGVIINKRDLADLEAAIHRALGMNTGKLAREFTLSNFSILKREKKILESISQHLG